MSRPGLANLGNTCFMNSLLQVLIDIDDLKNIFLRNHRKNNLFYYFEELYYSSKISTNNVLVPKDFHMQLQKCAKECNNKLFTGYDQNDCSELLMFLLDIFHKSIKREVIMTINGKSVNDTDDLAIKCYNMKKDTIENSYSEIYDLFYFVQVEQILDKNKKILNNIPNWFCQLSLPLIFKEKNQISVTLDKCIDNYLDGFEYEDTLGYYDSEDEKNKKLIKIPKFWDLPKVLVIVLQRFSGTFNKNNILVDFPITNLDMSKYVIGYNNHKFTYDLIGICNHSGGIHGGHYTSYSKTNNQWYLYNDSNVSLVKNMNNLISNNAYCLFYKKKT